MKTIKNRGGRPRKSSDQKQTEYLDVRLTAAEKQAFQEAAEIAGASLSTWVRERLRQTARRELIEAGRRVAFLQESAKGSDHG